ncbi:hypothetical protein [uncultured Sphingomonas sp.]|uniref:DUF6961 family protein n=1 Tax=uncultured Sphingomonas sp. TaxID=158754 RepID=UPI0025DEE0CB|nr:hypothetical protein [uncultured Sphingomonas sp.]
MYLLASTAMRDSNALEPNDLPIPATMTSEQERWDEALAVDRLHGPRAPLHVTERIGTLALADDLAGMARWKEIAARLDLLMTQRTLPPQ